MVTSFSLPARDFRSQPGLPIPLFSRGKSFGVGGVWEWKSRVGRMRNSAPSLGKEGCGRHQSTFPLARAQRIKHRPGIEARVWWRVLAKSHVKSSSGRRLVSASRNWSSGAGGPRRRQPLQAGPGWSREAWRARLGRGRTSRGGREATGDPDPRCYATGGVVTR